METQARVASLQRKLNDSIWLSVITMQNYRTVDFVCPLEENDVSRFKYSSKTVNFSIEFKSPCLLS